MASGPSKGDPRRANPDLLGAAGSIAAPLVNRLAPTRAFRRVLARTIGLPLEAPLPRFHRTPFDRWFRKREKRLAKRTQGTGGRVVLFPGCATNYHEPDAGRSAVAVLAALDVRLAAPDQRCCGLYALEAGERETAIENVRANTRAMRWYVAQGYQIAAFRGECAAMLRERAPSLDFDAATAEIAGAVRLLDEVLERLRGEGVFAGRFRRVPGRIAVHLCCQRGPDGTADGLRLLAAIPGVEIERIEGCCGGAALWRGDREAVEETRADRAAFLDAVRRTRAPRLVTDCFYAALMVRAECGIPAVQPVEIVREAMELPFPR